MNLLLRHKFQLNVDPNPDNLDEARNRAVLPPLSVLVSHPPTTSLHRNVVPMNQQVKYPLLAARSGK